MSVWVKLSINVVPRLAVVSVIGVKNCPPIHTIVVGLVSRATPEIVTVALVSQKPSALLVGV